MSATLSFPLFITRSHACRNKPFNIHTYANMLTLKQFSTHRAIRVHTCAKAVAENLNITYIESVGGSCSIASIATVPLAWWLGVRLRSGGPEVDPRFSCQGSSRTRGRVVPGVESYQGSSRTSDRLVRRWLPCQAPGVTGSALGLVGQVSVYCDWVR